MPALWLRFRAELRTRWRAWLGLALLVGFAAGAVIALAAGARRTDSAYARFLRTHGAADILVISNPEDETAIFDANEVARLPEVAEFARATFGFAGIGIAGGTVAEAPLDDKFGVTVNRLKVLEGRLARADRPDEATVSFDVADANDLRVGSRIPLFEATSLPRLGTPEFEALEPSDQETLRRLFAAVPDAELRVVGIVAAPGEFPPPAEGLPCCVHLSPALADLEITDGEVFAVRLRGGADDLRSFLRRLDARSDGLPLQVSPQADQNATVQRSIHAQAVALWILAGLVALAAALVLAQLVARLPVIEGSDNLTLGALGMTRGHRFALATARALVIGIAASVLASVIAVLASPIFPTGSARIAEPDVGLAFDGTVLGLGVLLTVLVVPLVAAIPAWRAARMVDPDQLGERHDEPSRLGETIAGLGGRAPTVVGVRMALERGRGRAAVPVRSSLLGVALGLAALAGAITFAASLDHLLGTPRLYGDTADLLVTNYGSEPPLAATLAPALEDSADVTAYSRVGGGLSAEIRGTRVDVLAISGDVHVPVVEGRQPRRGEMLLGSKTMETLGLEIGDTARVRLSGIKRNLELRVAGRAVLPNVSERAQLGTGAVISLVDAVGALGERREVDYSDLALRLRSGADPAQVLAALNDELCKVAPPEEFCGAFPLPLSDPTDILNFGRVQSTPWLVGGVLATLAAGTLAQVLASAVRRRRRELAVLKTLGFTRSEVRRSIAAQATTTIGIALLIGLPLGVVIGRLLWSTRADALGIVNETRVGWLALLVLVPVAFVVANLIAAVPAFAAARTRAATVLRTE